MNEDSNEQPRQQAVGPGGQRMVPVVTMMPAPDSEYRSGVPLIGEVVEYQGRSVKMLGYTLRGPNDGEVRLDGVDGEVPFSQIRRLPV